MVGQFLSGKAGDLDIFNDEVVIIFGKCLGKQYQQNSYDPA
jgi:hypothetical protein